MQGATGARLKIVRNAWLRGSFLAVRIANVTPLGTCGMTFL